MTSDEERRSFFFFLCRSSMSHATRIRERFVNQVYSLTKICRRRTPVLVYVAQHRPKSKLPTPKATTDTLQLFSVLAYFLNVSPTEYDAPMECSEREGGCLAVVVIEIGWLLRLLGCRRIRRRAISALATTAISAFG